MATRSKHLALQNDLKESLTKSRERLARLTSLEQGRIEVESDEESNDDDYSNQTSTRFDQAARRQNKAKPMSISNLIKV